MSCSYIPGTSIFQKREKDYLNARSIPPLKIPPGLSSDTIQNYYPVTYRERPPQGDVNITPPGLYNK
jgi:uncharacterized lipoprotein